MDSDRRFLIPLREIEADDEHIVGGKAAKLGRLANAGFDVPAGFCLTTHAYEEFLQGAEILATIRMELGRKPMDDMRWEEIWDAALRIRAEFLAHPLSAELGAAIEAGLHRFDPATPLAVRSSAIGEDSAGRSFAGLHESIIGVRDLAGLRDAVRVVWASLWSDAALLYRRELGLDPASSRMAVLVQEIVEADRSGVAFARDPRDARAEVALIESVPGACSLLVDGVVDPDRWEMSRLTKSVIRWIPGQREEEDNAPPLLETVDLAEILEALLAIERLLGWAPDMEWTGRAGALTILQARPITTSAPDSDEKRAWYLSLRPGDARLQKLRGRVVEELIPALEAEGQTFADEDLEVLADGRLATAIDERREALTRWKQIYWDEFIPFAHGIRRLATYYNDTVQPDDPYEFVGLLRGQPLIAAERNRVIEELAGRLAANDALHAAVSKLLEEHGESLTWHGVSDALPRHVEGVAGFVSALQDLNERYLDVAYDHERLQPAPLLRNLSELADSRPRSRPYGVPGDAGVSAGARHRDHSSKVGSPVADEEPGMSLEQRLLRAVGPERRQEALEIIETGRVSWKLRDDDNLLVARLESQLLRAIGLAADRLRAAGRLSGEQQAHEAHAETLANLLREPSADPIELHADSQPVEKAATLLPAGETPRQLIGQPASPGVTSGVVRCIRGHRDLGSFRRGEVLVCDAIQPTMTHLVPLASAIVERRGGMLIHGAIIARELGIPCVNGVRKAADVLRNGDLVTVDGHLGIVTVGAPEFDLESRMREAASRLTGSAGGFSGSAREPSAD